MLIISGRQIDGVWHTGIVAYGEEFFYGGGGGIMSCNPVSAIHLMITVLVLAIRRKEAMLFSTGNWW